MMNCQACQRWLQNVLDDGGPVQGDPLDPSLLGPAGVSEHLASCPDCAAQLAAARQLLAGLRLLRRPVPPPDLTDRLVGTVEAELSPRRTRRPLRWRSLLPVAAAAGLLVALGLYLVGRSTLGPHNPPLVQGTGKGQGERIEPDPQSDKGGSVPDTGGDEKKEPPTPLRDTVAEAGSAVASLTSRTADVSLAPPPLWPMLPAPPLDPMVAAAPAGEGVADTARPLAEAGAEVSAGLEPVTTSARRALDMFLNHVPRGEESQPDKSS